MKKSDQRAQQNLLDTGDQWIRELIARSVEEDSGPGDPSSEACIAVDAVSAAYIVSREKGVISGLPLASEVFRYCDESLEVETVVEDGDPVNPGDTLMTITGNSRSILRAERPALNFIQHLSAVSTHTRKMTDRIKSTNCRLLDTRKTTPGWRVLEKYAVRLGGGVNHRMGLYDEIMLKDNHIDFAGGIKKAVQHTQVYKAKNRPDLPVVVEVRNPEEVKEVLNVSGVDRILLDNFSPALLKEMVELINGRIQTEASGGIGLENIEKYAATGVDFLSSGEMTQLSGRFDLSLNALS